MALDSTGQEKKEEVPCVFCPDSVVLKTYTPEYGHDGRELAVATSISLPLVPGDEQARNLHKLDAGQMYRVHRDEEGVFSFHPVRFDMHGSPYAYGGFELPDFGFKPGGVIWCCEHCDGLLGGIPDELRRQLVLHQNMHVVFRRLCGLEQGAPAPVW